MNSAACLVAWKGWSMLTWKTAYQQVGLSCCGHLKLPPCWSTVKKSCAVRHPSLVEHVRGTLHKGCDIPRGTQKSSAATTAASNQQFYVRRISEPELEALGIVSISIVGLGRAQR
eukprot:3172209-Amphidinium_carterae.2